MKPSETMDSGRGPAWVAGCVVLLMAAAVVLRVVGLDAAGLWYDELILATLVSEGPGRLLGETVELARPPLFSVLAWLWMQLFGDSEGALRSLSAVFGVASVPVMFAVGRRLLGWRAGLIAAGFVAFGPFQVYYAQEYRYYAAVMCFSLCCVWFGLRAMGVGGRRGGGWNWAGYVGFGVAAVYCHVLSLVFFAALFVAGVGLWWRGAIDRREAVRGLVASVVAGAMSLPMLWWLWHAVTDASSGSTGASMSWIKPPVWWAPVQSVGNFLLLSVYAVRPAWVATGLLLVAVGVAVHWRRRRAAGPVRSAALRGQGGGWWVAACLAVLPLALGYVLSVAVKPVYVDRYYIAASMGWYVLLAGAIVAAQRWLPLWAGLGAVLLAMSGSLVSHYDVRQHGGSGWREAALWLDEQAEPDDGLLFLSERGGPSESRKTRENWGWYGREEHVQLGRVVAGGGQMQDPASLCMGVTGLVDDGVPAWLVVWTCDERQTPLAEDLASYPGEGLTVLQHEVFNDIELIQVVMTGQAGQADGGDRRVVGDESRIISVDPG